MAPHSRLHILEIANILVYELRMNKLQFYIENAKYFCTSIENLPSIFNC